MSRISQADKNRMYELAVEIIEHKRENPNDYMGAVKLYDQTDAEWTPERIKSLLDELKNVETMAREWRGKLFVTRISSRLVVGDRVFNHTENAEALKYAEENGLTLTPVWNDDEKSFKDYMEHWYGKTS